MQFVGRGDIAQMPADGLESSQCIQVIGRSHGFWADLVDCE
jgi:hypothetical protein